ncbi:hypothetical protein RclHR1_00520011 [Rhizophagus clarus]|uniref:Uncharacterized protein n=1 Tax=Rhizophagus clarus TaxID=94130 RepID=A0A2Z6SER0_9GLOM|nr:hypothetical protein RclHR1_00520011 [Rhizophagus clarus]
MTGRFASVSVNDPYADDEEKEDPKISEEEKEIEVDEEIEEVDDEYYDDDSALSASSRNCNTVKKKWNKVKYL